MQYAKAAFALFTILPMCSRAESPGANLSFKSVSIRPGTPVPGQPDFRDLMATRSGPHEIEFLNASLAKLAVISFGGLRFQVSVPAWTESKTYNITAKLPKDATPDQVPGMLQNLLKDRFGLEAHHETRTLNGYVLTVAADGPKFKEASPEPPVAGRQNRGPAATHTYRLPRNRISDLVPMLESMLMGPVVDKTGLTGLYNMNLACACDPLSRPVPASGDGAPFSDFGDSDAGKPPDPVAEVREQLGLILTAAQIPTDVVVVDHLEPTPSKH